MNIVISGMATRCAVKQALLSLREQGFISSSDCLIVTGHGISTLALPLWQKYVGEECTSDVANLDLLIAFQGAEALLAEGTYVLFFDQEGRLVGESYGSTGIRQ